MLVWAMIFDLQIVSIKILQNTECKSDYGDDPYNCADCLVHVHLS